MLRTIRVVAAKIEEVWPEGKDVAWVFSSGRSRCTVRAISCWMATEPTRASAVTSRFLPSSPPAHFAPPMSVGMAGTTYWSELAMS